MPGISIGYARVSTRDQNLELQRDALTKAGCETSYQEKVSGASASRPGLERLLTQLRTGDTVYIYKPDGVLLPNGRIYTLSQ